jgi:spermidine synthase
VGPREYLAALGTLALFATCTFFASRHAGDYTGDRLWSWLYAALAAAGVLAGRPWAHRGASEAPGARRALGALAMGFAAASVSQGEVAGAAFLGTAGLCTGVEIRWIAAAHGARRHDAEPFLFAGGLPWSQVLAALGAPVLAILLADRDAVFGCLAGGAMAGALALAAAPDSGEARPLDRLLMATASVPALLLGILILAAAPVLLAILAAPVLALRTRRGGALPAAALLLLAGSWLALARERRSVPVLPGYALLRAASIDRGRAAMALLHRDGRALQAFAAGLELFTDRDDPRLSESLVHAAMAVSPRRTRVLLVGGECSGIPRELAKYRGLERLDLLRLHPGADAFCRSIPALRARLGRFPDARLHRFRVDDWGPFYRYLERQPWRYDVILAAPPHPPTAPAELHSGRYYEVLRQILTPDGVLMTRLGSYAYRDLLHCARSRLAERFAHFRLLHLHLASAPASGHQVLALASSAPLLPLPPELPVPTRAVDAALLRSRQHFPKGTRWPRVAEPRGGCTALAARAGGA